jgi:hypothetical protein
VSEHGMCHDMLYYLEGKNRGPGFINKFERNVLSFSCWWQSKGNALQGCRCDERLKAKAEGSTRLVYRVARGPEK